MFEVHENTTINQFADQNKGRKVGRKEIGK